MSEGGQFNKILLTSENVIKRTLSCSIFHRVIDDRLKREGISSLPSKKDNEYYWLDNFLCDLPLSTKCLLENLVHYEVGEITSGSIKSLDSYLETVLTATPKVFLQQMQKLLEKCFKLTFTNLALNEFLLDDLGRQDHVYTEELDSISAIYNIKTKKIEGYVEDLEAKLKKIKNGIANSKDNKKQETESNKLKSKVTALEKQNFILVGKCMDLENKYKELVVKNADLQKNNQKLAGNHREAIGGGSLVKDLEGDPNRSIMNSVNTNQNTSKDISVIPNDKIKESNDPKMKKVTTKNQRNSVISQNNSHKKADMVFNSSNGHYKDMFKREKSRETKKKHSEDLGYAPMGTGGNNTKKTKKDSVFDGTQRDAIDNKKTQRERSKEKISVAGGFGSDGYHGDDFVIEDEISKTKKEKSPEIPIEKPNIKAVNKPKTTKVGTKKSVTTPTAIKANENVIEDIQFGLSMILTKISVNEISSMNVYNSYVHRQQMGQAMVRDAYCNQLDRTETSGWRNRDSYKSISNYSDQYEKGDMTVGDGMPLKNDHVCNWKNEKIADIQRMSSFSSSGNENNEKNLPGMGKDTKIMQSLSMTKHHIFNYVNYNQILSQFVELLPQIDKKRGNLLSYHVFIRNYFELAYYLINNSGQVIFSSMEEMVDCPAALPQSFNPKTKYWSKIITQIEGKDKDKDLAFNKSQDGSSTGNTVKSLLGNAEANSILQNVLNNVLYNIRTQIDDIRYNFQGTFSRLLDGDEKIYVRTLELKKALNVKKKAISQMFEQTKICVLGYLLQRRVFQQSQEELIWNDRDIEDILDHEKWANLPRIYQELKIWANNLRYY